jgi:hypothetical protein
MRALLIAVITMLALGAVHPATANRGTRSPRSRLFVLSVGISSYENAGLADARYTAGDARGFARTLTERCGTVFSDVSTRVLTNEQATRSAILEGLDWIQRESTSADVAIIYLGSREGCASDGVTYIAPYDFERRRPLSTGLNLAEFARAASQAAARTVLFFDPHPQNLGGGGFTELRGHYDLTTGGRFSEFLGDKFGVSDLYSSRHSDNAFARHLIGGLKGGSADANGYVTLFGLTRFVEQKVKLENGDLLPFAIKGPDMSDITLALASGGSR